jgi:hypothetical protein
MNGEIRGNHIGESLKIHILHQTLGNSYWSSQGLKSLYRKYGKKRHLFDRTAVYGTVRTVV